MTAFLNIGLNLWTALLINLLVIATATALTMQARSLIGRSLKAILIVASGGALALVVMSLPHERIF